MLFSRHASTKRPGKELAAPVIAPTAIGMGIRQLLDNPVNNRCFRAYREDWRLSKAIEL